MDKANQNAKPPTERRIASSSNDSSPSMEQRSSHTLLDGFDGLDNVSFQDDDTNEGSKLQKCKLSLGSNLTLKFNVIESSSRHVPKMVSMKNLMLDEMIEDEYETRREKKKQANRESARRSRLRKRQECEELEAIAKTLAVEVSFLTKQLRSLSEDCEALKDEITSLMDELVVGANATGMHYSNRLKHEC